MTDLELCDIAQFRDLVGIWTYHALCDELKWSEEYALMREAATSRAKNRTPFQWANAANGGFSPAGCQTRLPVNPNYAQSINVADQQADSGSLLNFYRRRLRVRKQVPALVGGRYTPLHEEATDYLAFLRKTGLDPLGGAGQRCLVVLILADRVQTLRFDIGARAVRPLFSSGMPSSSLQNRG